MLPLSMLFVTQVFTKYHRPYTTQLPHHKNGYALHYSSSISWCVRAESVNNRLEGWGSCKFPSEGNHTLLEGQSCFVSSMHAVVKASLSYFTVIPYWQPQMHSTIPSCQLILLLQAQKLFCTDWHFPSKLLNLSLSCLPPCFLLSAD